MGAATGAAVAGIEQGEARVVSAAAEGGRGGGLVAGHFEHAGVLLDESRQPLDLSSANSWSRKLGELDTPELLHTMAANAVAPFVLCSRLLPLLAPGGGDGDDGGDGSGGDGDGGDPNPHPNMLILTLTLTLTLTPILGGGGGGGSSSASEAWGHVVNVSALEGKFAVGEKS